MVDTKFRGTNPRRAVSSLLWLPPRAKFPAQKETKMKSTAQLLKNISNKTIRDRIRELVEPGSIEIIIGQEINSILAETLNEKLKAEASQILSRNPHERSDNPIYRNGYKPFYLPGLTGRITLNRPVTRKGSLQLPFLHTLKKAGKFMVNLLAIRFWNSGASTRNTANAINDILATHISPSDVSAATDCLEPAFTAWEKRSISVDISYLFLDATYLPVCRHKIKPSDAPGFTKDQALLAAIGIDPTGKTHVLGFLLGDRENSDSWNTLIESLLAKGLKKESLRLVVSDEHKAIIEAVSSKLQTNHQYCLVHKQRNVLLRIPHQDKKEVLKDFNAVYWASSRDQALLARGRFIQKWSARYPKATEIAFLNFQNFTMFFNEPEYCWKALRSSNRLERFNREIKRRTKSAGAMHSENELWKILWVVSIRQEESWAARAAFKLKQISQKEVA